MTFPEFQRAAAHQGREEMQTPGKSCQETTVQLWGRVLVPPQRIYITISLSPSAEPTFPHKKKWKNYLMHHSLLWDEGGPPEPSPGAAKHQL